MTRDLHPGPDLDDARRLVREALDAVEVPPYPGVAGPDAAPVHLAARRPRRPGPLALAAAAALVLGLGAAAVTLASSGDDVRTGPTDDRPPATTTTTGRPAPTTATPAPPASTPPTTPATTPTTGTTGPADAAGTPGGEPDGTTGTTAGEAPAAPELADIAEAASANGPVHLRGAMTADTPSLADDRVALRLSAEPWLPEVDWRHDDGAVALSRRWMVSAVYNQYVVWGVVGSDVTRVVVHVDDGTTVSATPAPIGSPSSGWSGFVAVLPQQQTIAGIAGERADGSVAVNATDLDANLAPLEPIARSTGEHIAYLPVTAH